MRASLNSKLPDISDCVLATVSIICIFFCEFDIFFQTALMVASASLMLNIIKSSIDADTNCKEYSSSLEDFFDLTSIFLPLIAWPCMLISTSLTDKPHYGFHYEIIGLCMLMLIMRHCITKDVIDLLVAVNSVTLVGMAFSNHSLIPFYAAILFTITYLVSIYLELEIFNDTCKDLCEYCFVAFMCYSAMRIQSDDIMKDIFNQAQNKIVLAVHYQDYSEYRNNCKQL